MKITIDEVELEFDESVALAIVGKKVTIKAAMAAAPQWTQVLIPVPQPSPWGSPVYPYCGDYPPPNVSTQPFPNVSVGGNQNTATFSGLFN